MATEDRSQTSGIDEARSAIADGKSPKGGGLREFPPSPPPKNKLKSGRSETLRKGGRKEVGGREGEREGGGREESLTDLANK